MQEEEEEEQCVLLMAGPVSAKSPVDKNKLAGLRTLRWVTSVEEGFATLQPLLRRSRSVSLAFFGQGALQALEGSPSGPGLLWRLVSATLPENPTLRVSWTLSNPLQKIFSSAFLSDGNALLRLVNAARVVCDSSRASIFSLHFPLFQMNLILPPAKFGKERNEIIDSVQNSKLDLNLQKLLGISNSNSNSNSAECFGVLYFAEKETRFEAQQTLNELMFETRKEKKKNSNFQNLNSFLRPEKEQRMTELEVEMTGLRESLDEERKKSAEKDAEIQTLKSDFEKQSISLKRAEEEWERGLAELEKRQEASISAKNNLLESTVEQLERETEFRRKAEEELKEKEEEWRAMASGLRREKEEREREEEKVKEREKEERARRESEAREREERAREEREESERAREKERREKEEEKERKEGERREMERRERDEEQEREREEREEREKREEQWRAMVTEMNKLREENEEWRAEGRRWREEREREEEEVEVERKREERERDDEREREKQERDNQDRMHEKETQERETRERETQERETQERETREQERKTEEMEKTALQERNVELMGLLQMVLEMNGAMEQLLAQLEVSRK